MSRRFPVYLLIDCSGSMRGAPIQEAQAGMDSIVEELMLSPLMFHCAYLSVITFANQANVVVPLTSLFDFKPPDISAFPCGGGSFLGAALELLETRARQEVRRRDATQRGDRPTTTFIITDGKPSDTAAYQRMAQRIRAREIQEIRPEHIIVCAAGSKANPNDLWELTGNALTLSALTPSKICDYVVGGDLSATMLPSFPMYF